MATVYDIVKGINQAAANVYDGSHDKRFVEEGEEKLTGLKREEGCPINDSRVIDGFSVRMAGPRLIVSYQSEMPMAAFHNTKLDQELEQTYADIIKFLKKEYKKITGDTLSLTEDGKVDFILQNMSQIRTWVQATKVYTVGNMTDVIPVGEPSENRLEANFKKFLELESDKKPDNVTRKDA
ncbi:MAG: hypothetical protein GOVbin630_58 [Prokaryotic dsDNA virus sp.]|nr:MAG: hypothetical protein GOVbin630_58 [Prokaryotic dsDNA virus sp.]|tara:strand:- start:1691 stop:2233 length:543 start_codon:yes stop_codon:yes gene_type:complete